MRCGRGLKIEEGARYGTVCPTLRAVARQFPFVRTPTPRSAPTPGRASGIFVLGSSREGGLLSCVKGQG